MPDSSFSGRDHRVSYCALPEMLRHTHEREDFLQICMRLAVRFVGPAEGVSLYYGGPPKANSFVQGMLDKEGVR